MHLHPGRGFCLGLTLPDMCPFRTHPFSLPSPSDTLKGPYTWTMALGSGPVQPTWPPPPMQAHQWAHLLPFPHLSLPQSLVCLTPNNEPT